MSIATYEEIKDLPNHPEKLLIDVREPNELDETGKIPTSINIPLKNLSDELALNEDDFKSKYDRNKPKSDTTVIFSCRLGGRAQQATNLATTLGFKNAKTYKGSWKEWSEKEGL